MTRFLIREPNHGDVVAGTRSRLARDVPPGAPEPKPEPQIGRDGVWHESPVDAPDAWEAWRRYDL